MLTGLHRCLLRVFAKKWVKDINMFSNVAPRSILPFFPLLAVKIASAQRSIDLLVVNGRNQSRSGSLSESSFDLMRASPLRRTRAKLGKRAGNRDVAEWSRRVALDGLDSLSRKEPGKQEKYLHVRRTTILLSLKRPLTCDYSGSSGRPKAEPLPDETASKTSVMDFVSWSKIVAKKAKGRIEMAKSVAKDDVDAGEEGKRSKDEQANDEMYSPSASVAPGR
ncbi:hypothetical protein M407DRAFT_12036 [Tulasnella calospora MUT 4182]|uniref:Uncharacterized protein n=1 Tax=Tulasnella calospora MUT 4182 TaxID=1051891 RepID=A0A0C3PTK1_9AGAM|nr:hypothetical protein M407DRAFT_12036 [Tulasnella calospora MUT 4182]